MIQLKKGGQATVEYIFILAIALFLGTNFVLKFTNFFGDSMGSVAHVLSSHLVIGACPRECWFSGYENSYTGSP